MYCSFSGEFLVFDEPCILDYKPRLLTVEIFCVLFFTVRPSKFRFCINKRFQLKS